jgi:hypothetical protein
MAFSSMNNHQVFGLTGLQNSLTRLNTSLDFGHIISICQTRSKNQGCVIDTKLIHLLSGIDFVNCIVGSRNTRIGNTSNTSIIIIVGNVPWSGWGRMRTYDVVTSNIGLSCGYECTTNEGTYHSEYGVLFQY